MIPSFRKYHKKQRPEEKIKIPRMLIVCGGEVTEPNYLRDFCVAENINGENVEILALGKSPDKLVDKAISKMRILQESAEVFKTPSMKYEEVWCVFDVDEYENISHTVEKARRHGIRTAVSNPCFELWILLHFQAQNGHIDHHQIKKVIKKHIPHYDKNAPFDRMQARYSDAIERAENLKKQHLRNDSSHSNPSTDIHLLLEALKVHCSY